MTRTETTSRSTLAASLAPEDVQCGDNVAVLNEMSEFASFLWDETFSSSPEDVVRVWWRPQDAGMPLRVEAVCLPFVFVKAANGDARTLDIRQVQLVRLSPDYAQTVRRHMKSKRRKKNKKK